MVQISAILICNNEEENISKALNSLLWVDEIVVVDSFSTDNTIQVIKENFPQVKLFQREFTSYADQKNWAIDQTSFEWVIILDSDEWFEENAEEEIRNHLNNKPTFDALRFPRINYYMNKRVKYSGWQNDSVIRLVNKNNCRYNNRIVHEEIETKGNIKKSPLPIHHNTYKNIIHSLKKIETYSSLKAIEKYNKGKKSSLTGMIVLPAFTFFKFYILRLGILDGKIGFILCKLAAYYVFLRQIKLWRIKQGEKIND